MRERAFRDRNGFPLRHRRRHGLVRVERMHPGRRNRKSIDRLDRWGLGELPERRDNI